MNNTLVIGDLHEPFSHKKYLDFCLKTKEKYQCNKTVFIGDIVDNHAISYHEHSPDGSSPSDEIKKALKRLRNWYYNFPKAYICKGNHDILSERKAITHGLPKKIIRPFEEIWEFPKGWEYEWSFVIDGVRYEHGTGYSGLHPHYQAMITNRQNTVIGHCHSVAGVSWLANNNNIIFGMSVGCGIDRKAYAFWYGRDFRRKPILGCGVVLNNGKHAEVIPMAMK